MGSLFKNELEKLYMKNAFGEPKYIEEETEEKKAKLITKKDLSVVGIPLGFYDALVDEENQVKNEFTGAVDSWDRKKNWALILGGKVGTGKSFAAAKWLLSHEPTRLSWVSSGMLADYKYNEYNLFKEFYGRPYLVIDDWGTEYDTDKKTVMSIFRLLLDQRHANQLATIITTNMTGDEIKQRYNDPRIRDRLRQGLFVFSDRKKSLRK